MIVWIVLVYITVMDGTSLWLVFVASVQQGRALERALVVLNGMSTHCHAYQNILEASAVGTPIYSEHLRT